MQDTIIHILTHSLTHVTHPDDTQIVKCNVQKDIQEIPERKNGCESVPIIL